MNKVFIVHGYEGSPNGGWRPWLMAELDKLDVYACALPMPSPADPICEEWVGEIARICSREAQDEIYLVGHSLGVPAILRYLESSAARPIAGAVLVSGPSERTSNAKTSNFYENGFEFERILARCSRFAVIHGDNDPLVPVSNAEFLAEKLDGELVIVENGGHLNGSAGWLELPQCLDALRRIMNSQFL